MLVLSVAQITALGRKVGRVSWEHVLVSVVKSESMRSVCIHACSDSHHGLTLAWLHGALLAAAARRRQGVWLAGKPRASSMPVSAVQSSDMIHIQMTPLNSLDSYASQMKQEGMEVAIYSGLCPLPCLACPHPPRTLQHQVDFSEPWRLQPM